MTPLPLFVAPTAVPCFPVRSALLSVQHRPTAYSTRRVRTANMSLLSWLFPKSSSSSAPIKPPPAHIVLNTPMERPKDGWKPPLKEAMFGLGCFWGAERKFWKADGVYTTSVGYAGGITENPRYREVCSGRTGHAEVVNVVFDETKTSYEKMLDIFWDAHDPTTRNRQGNDVGTQYRSAIYYYNDEQKKLAEQTRDHFNTLLKEGGRNPIVTEIAPAPTYFFAEDYHQQYLQKNPNGYCGLGGTGLYRPRK
eukprot:GFKZ01013512.1.p1 GENE.GFKZ01013512.1~~GFKZ01013512.1.p1  ORF type:complete len:251 (+),score=28.12 GFKZ01013512.1:106-858(+)